jgi:hypothetical protein
MPFDASPKGSRPQFSKLGHATKMALQVDSSNFFHYERIEIDEKHYNDLIWINLQVGSLKIISSQHMEKLQKKGQVGIIT